jgi:hypothetical protein
MPKPKRKSKAKATKTGHSAILEMARNSLDQAKGFAKQRYMGPGASSNIAHDLMLIKSLLNVEQKHSDNINPASGVTYATSLIQGVPTVGQGATSQTRTGDSIKVTRIDLSLLFTYSTGTTSGFCSQIFKYWLVRYLKTPSTSGTASFGISEFLNQDYNSNYTPMSLHNPDTLENFVIMAAGQVQLDIPFSNTVINNVGDKLIEISHECSYHQTYNGTAAGNLCDNMAYLVTVAINPTNTGGYSNLQSSIRMFYIDN